jgi:hypothetical protein
MENCTIPSNTQFTNIGMAEVDDDDVVVMVSAVERTVAISVLHFLLYTQVPFTTEEDFHGLCHFRFSIETPTSAKTVADVTQSEGCSFS